MAAKLILVALLVFTFSQAFATDPNQLQDFCVADYESKVFVNGYVCKDPDLVKAEDFFYSGLDKPGDTSENKQGYGVTPVFVTQLPGLNTLGVAVSRVDLAPYGVNTPHFHPRGSEIIIVIEGSLYAGFVTSNSTDYKLFTKKLSKGDVFVFPQGLIHFQFNYESTNAAAYAAFSSQDPGVIRIAEAVFGSNPDIPDCILAKTFQIDHKLVDKLKAQFYNKYT